MQRQKIFFIGLLFLSLLPAVYFSFYASGALLDFYKFKKEAPAHIFRWEINEKRGKFPIKGYYSFESNGKMWQGATRLKEPWHLNEASAKAALREMAKENWTVWFNPGNPSRSSLEKGFPFSLVLRTLICYGVILYFIFIFNRRKIF